MRTKLYLTLLFSILFLGAQSQIITGTTTIGSGSNQLSITVTVNSNINNVHFSITGPSTKWFGFAFNTTSMTPGSYTILANIGTSNPAEYEMMFHTAPVLQSTQNLSNFSSSTSGGFNTFEFDRPLNTGDSLDYVFTTSLSSLNIAWAYGSSTTLGYHQARGPSSISFSNPCANFPVTSLPDVMICPGDSAMIFGQYQSLADTYYDTLQSVIGCDSIVTQELLEVQIDTTITVNGSTLTANQAFATYQWYDCNTGMPISGATSMTYQPSVSGTYSVEITALGCSQMSSCIIVVISSTQDLTLQQELSIYPQPASDQITIEFPYTIMRADLMVFDLTGKTVLETNYINTNKIVQDISQLNNGIFFMKVLFDDNIVLRRIIVD